MAFRAPQGLPSLLEKRHAIRDLEEENANLKRDIENRRKLIHELEYSRDKQDEVIRRYLNAARPNETEFMLPGHGRPEAAAEAQPAQPKH